MSKKFNNIVKNEKSKEPPTMSDNSIEPPGVLLSDEIEECVDKYGLIKPFLARASEEERRKRLKPAAYHLSLGKECRIGGKPIFLNDKNNRYLRIEPYQVAIVETLEELNMPKNLIGRWNLSISCVYKGLLWVGGPQVDPGYKGHLYCPLYNLSTRPVIMEFEEPFATIDFVRTTPYKEDKSIPFKQKRYKLSDYNGLESAPKQTLDIVERTRKRMELFEATTLTVLGVIIAALAIISTSQFTVNIQFWPAVIWIIIAVVITFASGFFIGRFVGKSA